MIDRKLAGLCALTLWNCPAAFSQQTAQGQAAVFQVAPVPPARVPATIEADGETLQLQVVEESDDSERPYHYVSARIRNVPDGYARFAITGNWIVGTIVTPAATYRVLPATDGRPFALHLLARSNAPEVRFRLICEPWARAQELRHVQMERLEYIRPKHVWITDAGQYFSAKGGTFGKLATFDAIAVAAAMRNIAELTWAPDPLQLKIVRVVPTPDGTLVEFSQKVHGIPLSRTDRLMTDAQGTIVELTTQFVDPAWASNRRVISEKEGLEAALEQIAIATDSPAAAGYRLMQPTQLFYVAEGRTLVPYYTFNIEPRPNGNPVLVRVNAHSKAARLLVNPKL